MDFVNRPNYKPVKPRVIAKKLGLDEHAAANLKRAVKSLVKSGRVVYGQNHLVLPARRPNIAAQTSRLDPKKPAPATSRRASSDAHRKFARREFAGDRVTGIFRRMSAGYGFVRPTGAAPASDRSGDIFIAANHAGDAASGDTVLVAISAKRDIRRGNPEGEIVEILERDTHQFVGTYFEAAGNGYVQTDGTTVFQAGVRGRPRREKRPAQRQSRVRNGPLPFALPRRRRRDHRSARRRGAPGVDTLSVIREYNLPGEFPDDVLEDARQQAEKFDESAARPRRSHRRNHHHHRPGRRPRFRRRRLASSA